MKFATQDTILQNGDVELSNHESESKSDESFDELRIVSIGDTCVISMQEGTLQLDKNLL